VRVELAVACGTMMICCRAWGYICMSWFLPCQLALRSLEVACDGDSGRRKLELCGSRLQNISRDQMLGDVGAQHCRLPLQHYLLTPVSSYRETGPREHWKPKQGSHLDRQRSKGGYKLERCDAIPASYSYPIGTHHLLKV
jgi:hypothetical protein